MSSSSMEVEGFDRCASLVFEIEETTKPGNRDYVAMSEIGVAGLRPWPAPVRPRPPSVLVPTMARRQHRTESFERPEGDLPVLPTRTRPEELALLELRGVHAAASAGRGPTRRLRLRGAGSRWPTVLKFVGTVAALAVIAVVVRPLLTSVSGSIADDGALGAAGTTTTVDVPVVTEATVAPPVSATSAPATGPVAADPTGTSNVDGVTVTATCTARGSTDSAGNPIDFKPENTLDEDTATTWRCAGDGSG
ncbi:MAG: hypothetical protein R2705_16415 [Ilumatobacteraceae bacterium]